MDLSKLKNRPAYPFETIAVAVSFSPRIEAVLSEAKRLSDKLNANLLLMHIGEKTSQKENMLESLMKKLEINEHKCRVIWMDGEPVETILKLCKLNIVDLLILGALKKENILKYYLGSVARKISRKAKCSVLLLTEPSIESNQPHKVIVNGVENPKTINTINTALYISKQYKVKEITVVKETQAPAFAMTVADDSTAPETSKLKKSITEEESQQLMDIIERCESENIKVKEKIIKGKPGYAISKYAREKNADLLVVNSTDTHLNLLDRIFTHDIEYVLADLPCNVLIVHSRVS